MLVFIDESGDAGLKIAAGSTEHFVVIMVAFADNAKAQEADDRIGLLREEIGLPHDFEFHFSKLNHQRREVFLRTVATQEFFYSGIVIDKRRMTEGNVPHGDSFHQYACGLLFQNVKSYLDNAMVVMDGTGTRKFKQELQTYLKRCTNEADRKHIKLVRMQDSRTNNLLQLADMVSGAVRRSYGKKGDSELYRQLIARREINLREWP